MGFTPSELRVFRALKTPAGIQRFLDDIPYHLAGTAWAQHRGVEQVEVRADDGPWQAAQLATEVNLDTWRMWWTEVELPAGVHQVFCRATDKSGYTQTDMRAGTVPDGATGWHTRDFSCT